MPITNFPATLCPNNVPVALNLGSKVNLVSLNGNDKTVLMGTPQACDLNSFYIKPINCGTNSLTLQPASGTIEGQSSLTVTGCNGVLVYFDGTNWWVLSNFN